MKKEELIIGKTYRVKSREWFDKHMNEKFQVIENNVVFNLPNFCGDKMLLISLRDHHEGKVQILDPDKRSMFIPVFALEPHPDDKRTISKEILSLCKTIKSYTYIYASRNANGGGNGKTIETKDAPIYPCFDRYTKKECITLPGGDFEVNWDITQIRELVKNKKVVCTWQATPHTYITDTVILSNDKNTLPEDFSWQSHGFD